MTSFPVWVVLPSGDDVLVTDQNGLNAELAAGATLPASAPQDSRVAPGSTGITVFHAMHSASQTDVRSVPPGQAKKTK